MKFNTKKKNGDKTYFNRNIHIEPTNICVFDCKFCAYLKKISIEKLMGIYNRTDGK